MEQYKQPGGIEEIPVTPIKVSDDTKKIQSVESKVAQLQDTIGIQQQEIFRLKRDISRLKSQIDDVIIMVRNRG